MFVMANMCSIIQNIIVPENINIKTVVLNISFSLGIKNNVKVFLT